MQRTLLSTLVVVAVFVGGTHAQSRDSGAVLARVAIPQEVRANGQPLAAGRYEVRLTDEWLQPLVQGATQGTQWVEFYANGRQAGREAALVIPASEIGAISEWDPAPGATRVDTLKSGDFVRIWVNRDGTNYLIYLPTGTDATPR
jgi:hypothetical protein